MVTSEDSYGGSTLYTVTLIEVFYFTLEFFSVRDILTKKIPASIIWLKPRETLEFTPL